MGLDGVRHYRLLRSEHLADADVNVAGRFAYVPSPRNYHELRLIDLRSGRILRTTSPRFDGFLMTSG